MRIHSDTTAAVHLFDARVLLARPDQERCHNRGSTLQAEWFFLNSTKHELRHIRELLSFFDTAVVSRSPATRRSLTTTEAAPPSTASMPSPRLSLMSSSTLITVSASCSTSSWWRAACNSNNWRSVISFEGSTRIGSSASPCSASESARKPKSIRLGPHRPRHRRVQCLRDR